MNLLHGPLQTNDYTPGELMLEGVPITVTAGGAFDTPGEVTRQVIGTANFTSDRSTRSTRRRRRVANRLQRAPGTRVPGARHRESGADSMLASGSITRGNAPHATRPLHRFSGLLDFRFQRS
ncbi:MAG: hypothetical protein WB784_11895 [Rhodanobacteraceae bacterium]